MKFNAFTIIVSVVFSQIKADLREQDYTVPQNCTEIYTITTPRYVPYEEQYRARNWLGFQKYKTRINYRLENHVSYHKKSVCCSGYDEYGTVCKPHCTIDCGPNSLCAHPETCKCKEGFRADMDGSCSPICLNECENGVCIMPYTCACKPGYRMLPDGYTCVPVCISCSNLEYCMEPHVCRCINGYSRAMIERLDSSDATDCKPICDKQCINADCVEPNVCKCHEGYNDIDDDVFTCEPMCTLNCQDGDCVAPNTCACRPGYQLKPDTWNICEPVCTDPCVNAECIAPELCSCYDGFMPIGGEFTHICEAYCSSSCPHGRCKSPEECSCDVGYEESNNRSSCEPICSEDCYMGNCTAPNFCTCLEGYKLTEASNSTCEPVCDSACINGRCTAPSECTCNDGYEKKNSTDDSSKCIVICECENGNCSEASPMCETCAEGYDLTFIDNSTVCKPHCEGGCENGQCVEPQKCDCNDYYLADNDTLGNPVCVHACGDGCVHGNCLIEESVCSCSYGWSGKHCDVPTACAVVVPENEAIRLQLNESWVYDHAENLAMMEEIWIGPNCNKFCLDEINDKTKCVNQSIDEQSKFICFINIDALCNTYVVTNVAEAKTPLNISVIVISSIVSLLLVAAAVGTSLYIRKRKQEKSIELVKSIQRVQKNEEDSLIEDEGDGVSL